MGVRVDSELIRLAETVDHVFHVKVGNVVEANFERKGKYFRGVVHSVNEDLGSFLSSIILFLYILNYFNRFCRYSLR